MRIGVLTSSDFIDRVFRPEDKTALLGLGEVDFALCDEYGDLSDAEKTKRLHSYDILLSGWSGNALPADYTPDGDQYFCTCTGTVASIIKPEHLERGLRLTNWGDAISQYIAESALMQMLASIRMVGLHYQRTHIEKGWAKDFPGTQSLFDRNVALLGCGAIAKKLIPLLGPFGCKVHVYDPYVSDEQLAEFGAQRLETVRDVFTTCDVISNHLPKVEETNDLINAEMLALLPDHGIIVNTARGNSLDEDALVEEHKRGRLFSALDVFKQEPLPEDHSLRDEPRCLIMCHQAGPTHDGYYKMGERALENIRRYINGEELIQELTADHLRKMT